jgi:hypothetical protein
MATLAWPAHHTSSISAASPPNINIEIIDFLFEKDGKRETTYAMNNECTCVISVKNAGMVEIPQLSLELISDIKNIKMVGTPVPSWRKDRKAMGGEDKARRNKGIS